MKKIILAAGPLDPAFSYEYHNFLEPLEEIGCAVIPFDFLEHMRILGREGMNRKLLDLVRNEKPELVFFVPHTDQFIPEIVDEIGRHTVTLGYFFDDIWRIKYSRFWARHFRYITTSDVNGVKKFREEGFNNVIFSPFACNHRFFCRKEMPLLYEVSFVGQYHPYREWYITALNRAGIKVRVWGQGWPGGALRSQAMVDVFNQSRINLNLSNSFSWDVRYLITPFRPLKTSLRVWLGAVRVFSRQSDMKVVEMVKGRHFEINACGGFQLSCYVEGLERYYAIGKEIALYTSIEDMIGKIRYYLKHEDECEEIALRAHERTLKDHTANQRLREIIARAL